MRRSSSLVIALSLLFGTSGAVWAANDAPAGAAVASTGLPYVLSVKGGGGSSSVAVTLPDSATPIVFEANVRSTFTYDGTIVVTINGRRIAQVPARTGGPIRAVANADDVDKGLVVIGMYVQLDPQADCFVDSTSTATLANARLTYSHPVTPPSTIGTFLSPGLTKLTVQVGTKATVAEQQAALDAVASLVHIYPVPTIVKLLVSDDAPDDDFLNRTVMVQAVTDTSTTGGSSQSPATTSGGTLEVRSDGSLYLTGPPDTLASTAFALADPALSLFEGRKLENVAGTPDWAPATGKTSLADLGASNLSMTGVGTLQSVIAIDQPAFGQSLSAVQINLAGVITPLPEGASGRIDFTWNGTLIDSIGMSSKTALTPQINISAEQLRRNNQLGIQLSYVPTSGECTPQPLSARLDIDTAQSFVIPTSGDSVPPGFERFPQVLGSTIPIGIGTAGDPASLLQQAGDLVAALESATPEQLAVNLMSADEFKAAGLAGVLLGASAADTDTLGAPLTINDLISVGDPAPRFSAALPGPLALAQAFYSNKRDVVILGPIPTDLTSSAGQAALLLNVQFADQIATGIGRWAQLTGQVVSMGATGQLQEIALPAEPDSTTSTRSFLIVGIIASAFLVIGLIIWSRSKPRDPAPEVPGASTTG
ncbi:MAG: cellulose biosynthesis cyclic di-GMP-binding regulatory protein BcsB [Actinomycetota bacterium]|nr:cellulose biosynthesis cyclic di-GMP-binding regulatory protein BcsB [Actinomycetota bacterium]